MNRSALLLSLPLLVATVAGAAASGHGASGQDYASLATAPVDTSAFATVSATASDGAAAPVPTAKVVRAHAETLRPAPLPNQDLDAPGPDAQQLASQEEASLHPSFYSNSKHFAGDGFSPGSTLENEQINRRKPGGGMAVSIPMQ